VPPAFTKVKDRHNIMVSRNFLLAGQAIFTVTNPSGERYTYKVECAPANPPKFPNTAYLVSLLTGPDNTSNYRYLGVLRMERGPRTMIHLHETTKSCNRASSRVFKVCDWAIKVIAYGGYVTAFDVDGKVMVVKPGLPGGYKIQHAGKCGRCGRLLTVPESIESGIGPECAKMMGIAGAGIVHPPSAPAPVTAAATDQMNLQFDQRARNLQHRAEAASEVKRTPKDPGRFMCIRDRVARETAAQIEEGRRRREAADEFVEGLDHGMDLDRRRI
jgi:hypothetical protein